MKICKLFLTFHYSRSPRNSRHFYRHSKQLSSCEILRRGRAILDSIVNDKATYKYDSSPTIECKNSIHKSSNASVQLIEDSVPSVHGINQSNQDQLPLLASTNYRRCSFY